MATLAPNANLKPIRIEANRVTRHQQYDVQELTRGIGNSTPHQVLQTKLQASALPLFFNLYQ